MHTAPLPSSLRLARSFFVLLFSLTLSSHGQLYVTQFNGDDGGRVSTFNETTLAPINLSFITGVSHPWGLAFMGNTIFVASSGSGTVGTYNATTGAPLNPSFITGLGTPASIAIVGNYILDSNR